MTTISLFGYANSGKTTVAEAIVAEALHRDLRVAAVKVGHHGDDPAEDPRRDTDRIVAAGAEFAAYRAPGVWLLQVPDTATSDRDEPLRIPRWLSCFLEDIDLLVIEGRRVAGALVVQTVGGDGQLKISREQCHLILENVPENPLPAELMELVFGAPDPERREETMAEKGTSRANGYREICLRIDGREVELNGFVQDAFQEVVTGLVRSLGSEIEKGSIEIRIAGVGAPVSR